MSICASSCNVICPPDTVPSGAPRQINLTPGDSPTIRFKILTPVNTPFNLADYAVDFYIKRSMQDAEVAAEFHGSLDAGVEIGYELINGILDVTIPAEVTLRLRLHTPYFWYLRLSHQILLEQIYVPVRGFFLLALPNS